VNYRNDIEPVSNITVDWLEARVKAIRSDDDLNHAFPWIGSNYVAIWNDDLTHDNANFYRYRSIRGRVASYRYKHTYAGSEHYRNIDTGLQDWFMGLPPIFDHGSLNLRWNLLVPHERSGGLKPACF
jgi:hypothetical protein